MRSASALRRNLFDRQWDPMTSHSERLTFARELAERAGKLGMEFFRIAQLSASKVPVRDAALAAMRRLVNKCRLWWKQRDCRWASISSA